MEFAKYVLYRLVCDHPLFLRKFVDKIEKNEDVIKKWLDNPIKLEDGLESNSMYYLPDHCVECNAEDSNQTFETSQMSDVLALAQASAKFIKTVDIIMSVLENNIVKNRSGEPDKILVVSSFVKTLDLLEKVLEYYNIRFAKLNGQMSASQRGHALQSIQNDPEIVVFLLSFNAGGVGLNITSCNHLILLEPWWNPYAEDQVFGRIYRMGQKKKVFVYKMYTGYTIEEKILEVQEKKRQNIRGAFLGSCEPNIDSNEPSDADLLLLSEELKVIRANRI